jgi:hypothetical protein
MSPGGSLAGTCRAAGEPVRDFQVVHWRAGASWDLHTESFLDRDDGSFLLEGLQPGEVVLRAATPHTPNGPAQTVTITAGATAQVTLELEDALLGGGRVVDRETGEPVAGARVQIFTSADGVVGAPWGAPFECAADGTFELAAFARGANYLDASAEGYATASTKRTATGAGFLDWGDIRLARPQPLVVRLTGIEALDRSVTDVRVGSLSGAMLQDTAFERDGTARFEAVPPGDHVLTLSMLSSYSGANLRLALESGADWSFEHRIAGEHELDLRLIDADGKVREKRAQVVVSSTESNGIFTSRWVTLPDDDGWYRFEGIEAERVLVWVEHEGETLANRELVLQGKGRLEVDIVLGGERFGVRVVDGDGAPLSGAFVTIRSVAGEVVTGAATGSDGVVDLLGVPLTRVLADVAHETAGWRFGVALDGTQRDHELVMDASGALTLVLRDGDQPLADVVTRIETPDGTLLTLPRPTASDGTIRYAPVGEGDYRIVCRRADCWTTVVEKRLGAGEQIEVHASMRRLGDLELAVLDARGIPISAAEPTLTSVEFEVSVEEWITDGRVQGASALRTGVDGKLVLEGLPRGVYVWSLATPDGLVSDRLEIRPGQVNEVKIRLP